MEPKEVANPIVFSQCYIRFVKYLYLKSKFLAQRGHTHFEGSKKAQNLGKTVVKIIENF